MLGLFKGIKDFIPVHKKTGSIVTEGATAILHYRATSLLLLLCCSLVTALEWIANGKSITCIQEGPDDSWNIPPNVINTYCYIMSTFTLPKQLAGGVVGDTMAGPGVGAYNPRTDDVTYKAYYQWVPFVLMLQACLFYTPHLLHKIWEGGKIQAILTGLHSLVLDGEDRRAKQKVLAHYLVDNLNTHNLWAAKLVLVETVYFLNILGNLYLMDFFLGGEFRTYGFQGECVVCMDPHAQVASIMQEDPEDRVDPMSAVFPRVTKCTFKKFGPSGSLQTHDSLCVLPVNIINEKIYVFLWFWLCVLMVVTSITLTYHLFLLMAPSVRKMMLRSHAAHQPTTTLALNQVFGKLQLGDWRLLHLLGINMEPRVFGELIEEVAVQLGGGDLGQGTKERKMCTEM